MSERRIVVDPVTRIEGHLRVQAVLGDDGKIVDSMSTGTMWRGLEVILKGRDPRDAWAFVERICGVCTGIHALSAVRAVEDAIGIKIPKNANLIRNILNATLYIHDHIVHFYQLSALDWVDVVSALDADPRETAAIQQKISPRHPLAAVGYFRDVQNRVKKLVESGQLSIFNKGYWGHPAMKLPPAVNLLAVAHYLEVLDFQREVVRIHTILGGKNPHPNYLVGGVACPINVHDTGAQGTMVNEVTLNYMRQVAQHAIDVVANVYIPDIKAIASFYPDWFKYGKGLAGINMLSYGDFPEIANDYSDKSIQIPRGAILNGNLNEVFDVDTRDPEQVQEFVERTGVDSLAIAIGTSHGAYKFKPGTKPMLRFDILEEVEQRLPGFPIVLHGASSVIPEFVKMINEHGGNMPDAIGVPEDMLRKAASMAVCKINIDSDLRLAMTGTIRKYFDEYPSHFDPRQYLKPARAAIKEMVRHKIVDVLGCNGKA